MDLTTLGLVGYGLLMLAVVADSVVPVVPAEAAVMAAAGATTSGAMSLPAVVISVVAGALIGDIAVHTMGRVAGRRWPRRLAGRRRGASPGRLISSSGTAAIVAGRFVPLGRTAVAFSSGVARVPWRRYLPAATVGALTWAVVMTLIGRSATALSGNLAVTIAAGMAASATVGAIVTAFRRRRAPVGVTSNVVALPTRSIADRIAA